MTTVSNPAGLTVIDREGPEHDPPEALHTHRGTPAGHEGVVGQAINAISFLAVDAVGRANPSTLTYRTDGGDISAEDVGVRNIHFGMRRHAMAAIANCGDAHGRFRISCSTFSMFGDNLRPTLGTTAIIRIPVIFGPDADRVRDRLDLTGVGHGNGVSHGHQPQTANERSTK
ncbi:MAG: hypothetical protein ACYCS7_12870 [Acidimicrobiales bacterium]